VTSASRRGARAAAAVIALGLAAATSAAAQRTTLELMTGSADNLPTPLTVRQAGHPDVSITADYETRPFGRYAPYYAWRLTRWNGNHGWELQHVHHRLFLANPTAEIERFEIHFGYSYLLVGSAWRTGDWIVHAAGGAIITSPANRIRGRSLNISDAGSVHSGYELSGVGASLGLSRRFRVNDNVFVLGDAALMAATASVPVAGGRASAPNASLHGRLGVGFEF
jgi:hypothetical protein